MNDKPKKIKQVICMRHDLEMRRGKQITQGAHASMSFLTRRAGNWLGIAGRLLGCRKSMVDRIVCQSLLPGDQ